MSIQLLLGYPPSTPLDRVLITNMMKGEILPPRKLSDSQKREIIKEAKTGYTVEDVVFKYGISSQSFKRWCHKFYGKSYRDITKKDLKEGK